MVNYIEESFLLTRKNANKVQKSGLRYRKEVMRSEPRGILRVIFCISIVRTFKHEERKNSMKELNIEEIKEVNKKVYKNMVEIYGNEINDEMWGTKLCDALWELGYSVYKGEITIKDAKERLMKYRSYIYMRKMLCMMKGKRFNEKKEILDIDVLDIPVTKNVKNKGKVSVL